MDHAVTRAFEAKQFVYGGGVAIFHLASSRVVLCHHPREGHWFLPKGRRDAGEESRVAAEREGFEESGYRNRILPLPVKHRQPKAYNPADETQAKSTSSAYVREPVLTLLMPFGHRTPYDNVQYLVAWYVAETLPPEVEQRNQAASEKAATASNPKPYIPPENFPVDITLSERIALEPEGYEPIRHLQTGVDSDELTYESFLLPIKEACEKVEGTMLEYVIEQGWELIQKRLDEEKAASK